MPGDVLDITLAMVSKLVNSDQPGQQQDRRVNRR